MGVASLKQSGFGGGLVSPQALGRTDQQKYATGLRTCQNAWITRYGTVENRAGTEYIDVVKDSTDTVRLVSFIFSNTISYLLEFGEEYIRPRRAGSRIVVTGAAAYAGGTTYGIGDLVTYLGVVYYSRVAANLGNTPSTSPTQWYVQDDGLLEIPTDIPQAALAVFQYVQQNDVMTLTSQLFAPSQLLRYSDTKWAYQGITVSAGVDAPTNVLVVAGVPPSAGIGVPVGAAAGGTPGVQDYYSVAAWNASVLGQASAHFFQAGNMATAGFPITLTWGAIGTANGYAVYKNSANINLGIIAIVQSGLSYIDTGDVRALPIAAEQLGPTGSGVYTYVVTAIDGATGGESLASAEASAVSGQITATSPNVISWDPVDGAASYNVYRVIGGIAGFIGNTPVTAFDDEDFLPDTSKQPPVALTLFGTSDDWPAVCGYYQQRLCFANTVNEPQTVWMSNVGRYTTFVANTPELEDDAVIFTVAGKLVQPIQALVDLGKLIIHTADAEYVAAGNSSGTITPLPGGLGLTVNSTAGSTLLAPVVIGNSDLFIQYGATRILDLRFDVQSFTYAGKDLTKYATDPFVGRTITDFAWQKLPHSIVWNVLDDGLLAALTYVREDDLWAWHTHVSTNGSFENVAVIPENSDQVLYVVVRREIDGATVRYIERLASRDCLDTTFYADSYFADAFLAYDGRNTGSTTVTATAGTGWTPVDTVTLTASASTFTAGDVGDQLVLQQLADGTQVNATTNQAYPVGTVIDYVVFAIVTYTSPTVIVGVPTKTVPDWAQATALTSWGSAVHDFAGLDHLEGEEISVLADGNVASDPLDAGYPTITVSGGAFTLTKAAMVVVAGLPIQMDVQTLPLENAGGESIANKRVSIREVCPIFHNSRGGLYGQDAAHLFAWKQPDTSPDGYPIDPYTGPARVPIQGTPQITGQAWIRVTNPVPFGISAIVLSGEIGS